MTIDSSQSSLRPPFAAHGTLTGILDLGTVGDGVRPIHLNLIIGGETTAHEIAQIEGACVLPAWSREVIDPEGQAAGAILSFRCRAGIREEHLFRLVPGIDSLNVLRAIRPIAIQDGRPRGRGPLVFERITTIRLPADVSVVIDQGPPMSRVTE